MARIVAAPCPCPKVEDLLTFQRSTCVRLVALTFKVFAVSYELGKLFRILYVSVWRVNWFSSINWTDMDLGPGKKERHCSFCLQICYPAKVCSKCHKRAYCSRECQVADWKPQDKGQGHKTWCQYECGEEDVNWEVVPVPGIGLGIVARRTIPAVYRIIDEPVFSIQNPIIIKHPRSYGGCIFVRLRRFWHIASHRHVLGGFLVGQFHSLCTDHFLFIVDEPRDFGQSEERSQAMNGAKQPHGQVCRSSLLPNE